MIAAQAQRYPSEFEGKSALIALAARMQSSGWMPAGDGTLSVRTGRDTVWITAADSDKRALTQKDLLRVNLRGGQSQVGPNGIPPDDLMIHLRIYMENSIIVSIVHAYPPETAAWAAQGVPLPEGHSTPAVRRLGAIGIVTLEDAFRAPSLCADASAGGNGILLQNDGAMTWGDSPAAACQKMEALEYSVSIMNKQRCANCTKTACKGTTNCTACANCTEGLKGVTPILRPGDTIPDRKAPAPSPAAAALKAQPQPAKTPAARGKIPELTIVPHRYTDREKQKADLPVQPAVQHQRAEGPVVHRYSDQAAKAAQSKAARPVPAQPSVNARSAAQPAPVAASVVIAAPKAPGVPVKNAPRASVQAEVVRRLRDKL